MNLFKNKDIIVFKTNFLGKIIKISSNIEKILGYSCESLKDKYIHIIFDENQSKDFISFERNFLKANEYLIKDRYCEYKYFKPIMIFKDKKIMLFAIYDITSIKKELEKFKNDIKLKTEELTIINNELLEINSLLIKEIYERKKVEEKLFYNYSLLDNVKDAIIATLNNEDKTIVLWNKGAELIFGLSKDSVIGKSFYKILKFYFFSKSEKEKYCQLVNFKDFKGEMIFYKKNGEKIFFDVNIIPFLDKNNNITEWIGVYRDITERKEFEKKERLKDDQLIKSEKLASLGVLISGIVHEINNPNNYVKLNSKMLKKFYTEIKPILNNYFKNNPNEMLLNMSPIEALNNIEEVIQGLNDGSTKISNIIQSLKEFIQPDHGLWDQEVDVNNALKSSIIILNNLIKNSTNNFNVKYDYAIPTIKGNVQQLEQVLINIIVNACQSLKSKENRIFVSTYFDRYNNLIIIEIKDEGKGIPKEILDKIIEPFFTTKIDVGGTGLGLAISYNIIRKFKGNIFFLSEVDKGTTVTITLPVFN